MDMGPKKSTCPLYGAITLMLNVKCVCERQAALEIRAQITDVYL